jgi:hypothetical protein
MQIEALLDRTDFASAAGLKDKDFQGFANAGLIPACLGVYNGQPLWKRSDISEFCAKHNLPLTDAPPIRLHVNITTTPSSRDEGDAATSPSVDGPAASEVAIGSESGTPGRVAKMSVQDVCVRLGCSPATLQRRRELNLAPGFVRNSPRDIRYFEDDVEAIYREHGRLPRHYSPDGLTAIKANTAKARAAQRGKTPVVKYMNPPAQPLLEPKRTDTVGQKTVIHNTIPLEDAADHLGIEPLMLRILHKAGVGPKATTQEPLAFKMCDLNAYSTDNGLQPGQIARVDKQFLDQRVRVPEAATITQMSQKSLEHHRAKGTGPKWERQGIFSVYKRGDLYAYMVGKDILAEQVYDEQHRRAH